MKAKRLFTRWQLGVLRDARHPFRFWDGMVYCDLVVSRAKQRELQELADRGLIVLWSAELTKNEYLVSVKAGLCRELSGDEKAELALEAL